MRVSAGERAYEWIRDAILSGNVAEGEFLDEVALSREVGTSRTPVREALKRLHAERFIDLTPNRGAQVRIIGTREMEEVYETRCVLEAHAIRQICARELGSPPAARALVRELSEAGASGDWNRFAQLDQKFHSALVHWNGNDVLSEAYDALRPRQVRLAVRTVTAAPGRIDVIMEEHNGILTALDEHDSTRAVGYLYEHLRRVPEVVSRFTAE